MTINPSKRKFTEGLDQGRVKMIKYFTIMLIVLVPLFFAYQGINNIKPKKDEVQKTKVETGDRPIEKELKISIKADGGLNFRKEAKKDAEKIGKIPDGTKLTVKKEIEGWYQVEFEGKEGWIAKEFTVTEEKAVEEQKENEAAKDWLDFNPPYDFSLKYPTGWSAQDYGKQLDGDSIVGFSFSQLPTTLQPGFFMPIDVRISERARDLLESPLKSLQQKTVSDVDISGIKGVKYLYTDTSDSTEKTKIILTVKSKTLVISENGGYGTELEQILKTFKIN